MSDICTVTGILRGPDGAALAHAVASFLPAPVGARALGLALTMPRPVQVTADGDGALSVDLVRGVYTLRVRAAERELPPALIEVPDAAEAQLQDLIVGLPVPQSVYDAAASARRATGAAAKIETQLFAGAGGVLLTIGGVDYGIPATAVGRLAGAMGTGTDTIDIDGTEYDLPVATLEVI